LSISALPKPWPRASPALLVPNQLPWTRLPSLPAPVMRMAPLSLPATVFPAFGPPIRLPLAPPSSRIPSSPLPKPAPYGEFPAALVPMKLCRMTLLSPPLIRMPWLAKRLITRPCTVELLAVIVRPTAPAPAPAPLSSIIGVAAVQPPSVVASIVTVSEIVGSAEVRLMVWSPAPGIAKVMMSGTPGVSVSASMIACRSEPPPASFVLVTV